MARQGIIGNTVTLTSNFYQDGTLFNPYSVSDVRIYDASVGGNLVATITPTTASTGVYTAVWNIPAAQALGSYYDEWTWVAAVGLDADTQRGTLQVIGNTVLKLSDEASLETRLATIEQAISNLQVAVNNLVTRKQLNALMVLIQRIETEMDQELVLIKARLTELES